MPEPQDCLALVEQSPAAVAVHDKQAWLAIFARESVVEDPVGSAPHVTGPAEGRASLERFYETFIAANDIRFHVSRDIVCGLHVVRDLSLEITMAGNVKVEVPMHLLYELTEEEGVLRIARLAAHWELQPMLRQQVVLRWRNLKAGTLSFQRMLRQLGVRGIAGFMQARSTVGEEGKQRVKDFFECLKQRGDCSRFFNRQNPVIDFPYAAEQLPPAHLVDRGCEFRLGKTLAAGNFVTVSYSCRSGQDSCGGVAFFEFDRQTLEIKRLSFYW